MNREGLFAIKAGKDDLDPCIHDEKRECECFVREWNKAEQHGVGSLTETVE